MKKLAVALAIILGVSSVAPAFAQPGHGRGPERHGGWHPQWHHPHHDNAGPAIVGGIIGGVIGNIFAPRPEPQVVVVQPQAPVQWSAEWYNYCANKYRSFDARTGYYTGYDGRQYFCQ